LTIERAVRPNALAARPVARALPVAAGETTQTFVEAALAVPADPSLTVARHSPCGAARTSSATGARGSPAPSLASKGSHRPASKPWNEANTDLDVDKRGSSPPGIAAVPGTDAGARAVAHAA
jgi:hypothetical protein